MSTDEDFADFAYDDVERRGSSTIPESCPDREAALELCQLMSDISEEHWAAGWLIGLEVSLWRRAMEDPDDPFGFGALSLEHRGKLIELSHRCQGWWCWDEKHAGERFVTLDEWLPRYQDDVADE